MPDASHHLNFRLATLLNFRLATLRSVALSVALFGLAGCARVEPSQASMPDSGSRSPDAPAAGPDVATVTGDSAAPPGCENLRCRQTTCAGGGTTSISGTVFAPNGTLPLFNVAVYVPNAPLKPLKQGVVCDRCGGAASAIQRSVVTSALSNEQGKFRLDNVPVGKDIPLVVHVGKWRRQVTIANVTACQDNPLTDPNLTRLPRNRGEGDMPRIAVTTGRCDSLGCLLAKVGVDSAELGIAGQDRAVTFFRGDSVPMNGPQLTGGQPPLGTLPGHLRLRVEQGRGSAGLPVL